MIGLQYHNTIPTKAILNGPILTFVGAGLTQPISTSRCSGTAATFTGFATALFEGSQVPDISNAGILTYRWYEVGVGALSDSTNVTGSGTTILTISNLRTPQDSGRRFYIEADYLASVGAGGTFTGNAPNDPLRSETATLTVLPNISITEQPTSQLVGQRGSATFTVDATSTDSSQGSITYRWSLDGNDLNDGTEIIIPQVNQYNQTFANDATVDLASDAFDINLTVAGARGGSGGSDSGGSGGGGGSGRVGSFTLPDGGRTLTLRCGDSGSSGGSGNADAYGSGGSSSVAGGGRGGGAGPGGWSGGGGGGGGASGVFDSSVGSHVIVAGGGGGGGGGSLSRGASGGATSGDWSSSSGPFSISDGSSGSTAGGDGGGGGGGGGGATGGGGGGSGQDNSSGGGGGGGGGSRYNSNASTFVPGSSSTNSGDGYISLQFKSSAAVGEVVTTQRTRTVSGSSTRTLTLTSDVIGLSTVRCRVTNTSACNSPILSDVVNYNVVASRSMLNYETNNGSVLTSSGSQNLFNGLLIFYADPSSSVQNIIIYPSEQDIIAKVTLAGSAGVSNGSNRGGYGGVSVFEYTLRTNVEYVIKMQVSGVNGPGGNIGGGCAAYFYEGGRLIACSGAGGGAGTSGRGGDGGGMGIAGENGYGSYGGRGGQSVSAGSLPTNGFFPGGSTTTLNTTASTGGRVSSCTIGNSYFSSRYSACADIGNSQFRNASGTIISGTATILRGFKSGLAYRNNGGNGSGSNGGGGQGAYGGDAGGGSGSGGGGGSGYSSGDATVINSTLGGNTSTTGYTIIELA